MSRTDKQIMDFFAANPGEYLTVPDMVVKFGRCEQTIQQAIARLKDEGVLQRSIVFHPAGKAAAR